MGGLGAATTTTYYGWEGEAEELRNAHYPLSCSPPAVYFRLPIEVEGSIPRPNWVPPSQNIATELLAVPSVKQGRSDQMQNSLFESPHENHIKP